PVLMPMGAAFPLSGGVMTSTCERSAGATTLSFAETSIVAAVFCGVVRTSATATGGAGGFIGSPGRTVTRSASTPPALDWTEMLSGGSTPGASTFVKAPATIGPPSGPTTVKSGPVLSLEIAATLSVLVSESNVAVVISS